MEKATRIILSDDRCTGCSLCSVVCSTRIIGAGNPEISGIYVWRRFESGEIIKRICEQCGLCHEVCPRDAIIKEDGYYRVDRERCDACYLCTLVCPQDIISIHPRGFAIKCDMCGGEPLCVRFCTKEALEVVEETPLIPLGRKLKARILSIFGPAIAPISRFYFSRRSKSRSSRR